MTDNNDDKTFGGAKKTLTLKPSGVSQGTVRQDMGRGRTKAVVVETRKRRPMRPEDEKPVVPIATPAAPVARVVEPQRPAPTPQQQQPSRPVQTQQQPQQPRAQRVRGGMRRAHARGTM